MNRKQKRTAERQRRKEALRGGRRAEAPAAQASGEPSLAAALQLHQAGRLDEAQLGYDAVLRTQPNHPEALHFKGVVLLQKGDAAGAAPLIERAIAERTSYPEALVNLGLVYRTLGRLADAAACYRRVLATHPNSSDTHNNLGVVFKDQGELNQAHAAFAEAIRLRPDFVEAWNNLGIASNELGRREEAIAHLLRAIALVPSYSDALVNLGNLLVDIGELDKALEISRKAVAVSPGSAAACHGLGKALAGLWQFDEAIEYLRRAVELEPGLATARVDLAVTLQRQGHIDASLAELRTALRYDPKSQNAWDNMAVALRALTLRHGSDDLGLVQFSASLKNEFSDSPEPWLLEYSVRGVLSDDAGQYFDAALEHMPLSRPLPSAAVPAQPKAVASPAGFVALLNYGRSGSGLLHSLLDWHPQVSTLPGILMKGYFAEGVWADLSAEGSAGLVPRFLAMYEVLFDATSSRPVPSGVAVEDTVNLGISEGLTATGENANTALKLDRERFGGIADAMIAEMGEVDQRCFLEIVHAAHDLTLGRPDRARLIFYHIHNPGPYALLNCLRHFPETKLLMAIREPIQNIESWIVKLMQPPFDYIEITSRIGRLLNGFAAPYFAKYDSRAIALEHLKRRPDETLGRLCNWLGIDDDPCLRRQTARGEKWWGDPTGLDYQVGRELDPFDAASVDQPWGRVLTQRDIAAFATLFRPFSYAHGLTAIDPMSALAPETFAAEIDAPFDFERRIFADSPLGAGEPSGHVGYQIFHGILCNRLAVLARDGTYPDMIMPL